MLARRLSMIRRTTVLTPIEPLPIPTPTYMPVNGGFQFITATKVDGTLSFARTGLNSNSPDASYPYISSDELGWTYGYIQPPITTVRRSYRQVPGALVSPPAAETQIASIPKMTGPRITTLRDCVLSYADNATSIARSDWSGVALTSIDLSTEGLTTGAAGLWTSSGRHAVSFKSGKGDGHLEMTHQTASRFANASINPDLGLRQQARFQSDDAAYDFPASIDFEFGFTVSASGELKKVKFNSDLFPLVVPAGASGVPVWKCLRKVEEFDRCQGVDEVYILARLFAQEIRSNGTHEQVFWGSKFLRRIRASYSARHMVAILKVVDDQVSIHRVLIDGASTFSFGDYSYHQTERSTDSYYKGIEWTRATVDEGLIENTSVAITDNASSQISETEYLQHFDHISEPGDPAKPWLLGYPISVIDRIPEVSGLVFSHYNAPTFNETSRANNTLKLAFDGEFFYIVRGLPVSFDGEQPIYKISNVNNDISILQSALFNNSAPVRRLQAFPSESILYVDAVTPTTVNYDFAQWQVDIVTGSRLTITNPTSVNRSLARTIPDNVGIIKLINASVAPE